MAFKTRGLVEDILVNLQHGECMYDQKEFNELILSMEEAILTAKEEFKRNQEDDLDD